MVPWNSTCTEYQVRRINEETFASDCRDKRCFASNYDVLLYYRSSAVHGEICRRKQCNSNRKTFGQKFWDGSKTRNSTRQEHRLEREKVEKRHLESEERVANLKAAM